MTKIQKIVMSVFLGAWLMGSFIWWFQDMGAARSIQYTEGLKYYHKP